MEKVICDVCGTDYPETAAQCPICGCARSDSGQTSAGNTGEGSAYTYTKGGRFSKTNVRKRLKAAQIQPVPVEIPTRSPEPEEPDYDDYDDYDEDDVDEEPTSNRGLIVVVVLLLLAIIAVSSYIAIVHFDLFGTNDTTKPNGTTGPSQSTTSPTDFTGVRVPCTALTADDKIVLAEKGGIMQLSFSVEPIDTTDEIKFESSDEGIATVDANGRVTAVGDGEATITITCGDFVKECKVSCVLSGEQPDDPSDPTDPTDPVEPVIELKLNREDFTLNRKGSYWTVYTGELDPSEIVWTSKNENVVTVTDGRVVAVGVGRTQIVAEYKGQTATCWVSCSWEEETPVEPDQPVDPDDPQEPANVYYLKVNNLDPYFPFDDHSCEVSIKVGSSILLTVVDDMEGRMDVTWTASKDGYVTIDGFKVTGEAAAAAGVTLTATYDGQTFTCIVRVYE